MRKRNRPAVRAYVKADGKKTSGATIARPRGPHLPAGKLKTPSRQARRRTCERYHLSKQEAQVMKMKLDDVKERIIAWRLKLGLGTVNTYCTRLYKKLKVHDRLQLLLRVMSFERKK